MIECVQTTILTSVSRVFAYWGLDPFVQGNAKKTLAVHVHCEHRLAPPNRAAHIDESMCRTLELRISPQGRAKNVLPMARASHETNETKTTTAHCMTHKKH